MPWSLERAVEKDLPVLADLLAQLFTLEVDFGIHKEAQIRGLRMVMRNPQGVLWCAWEDRKIVGMVSGQIVFSSSEGAPSVWVEDLIVTPEARGKGIGSALVGAVEAWGRDRGATRLQLVADKQNHPALDFYRHRHWKETRLTVLKRYL